MESDPTQQLQESIGKLDTFMRNMDRGPIGATGKAELWMIQHPTAAWMLCVTCLLILLFSIWTCLRQTEGIDRLTWLVLILALPGFGVIFFWILFNRPEREHSDLNLYRTTPPPAPAPTKAERSIAEAVNASIAESVRTRKLK